MELPTKPIPAKRKDPKLLVLFGQSKVGKTTQLTKLEDCLIVDTEKGTDLYDALKVNVGNLKQLGELYKALGEYKKENDGKKRYKYIALDTLDHLALWLEAWVCVKNQVPLIGDMAYGSGYSEQRLAFMKWIERFNSVCDHLILIGHIKKQAPEGQNVEVSQLELSGRLKNQLMAEADAIGLMFRADTEEEVDKDGKVTKPRESKLMVSFRSGADLEAGSRTPHLIGKVMEFDWKKIYVE